MKIGKYLPLTQSGNAKRPKKMIFTIAMLLAALVQTVSAGTEELPLGIVLKVQGRAWVQQSGVRESLECGSRIYDGAIIEVGNDDDLLLLDLESKERISLSEGRYEYKAEFDSMEKRKQNEKSVLRKRLERLVGMRKIETAAFNVRGVPKSVTAGGNTRDFDRYCQPEETPNWVTKCLDSKRVTNRSNPEKLNLNGILLPQFSLYLQMPGKVTGTGRGEWIVSQSSSCRRTKRRQIEIDSGHPPTYLVWKSRDGSFQEYCLAGFSDKDKRSLESEIRILRKIWNDPDNLNYLWAVYQVYLDHRLQYQALKALRRIEKQL
ncbi:MAG: hypothetical protein GY866_00125 [Proteobacteria bacterium]|nr:hypothetical protein [Pseudomonadota bacterium]